MIRKKMKPDNTCFDHGQTETIYLLKVAVHFTCHDELHTAFVKHTESEKLFGVTCAYLLGLIRITSSYLTST